jgi:hypothetical protein
VTARNRVISLSSSRVLVLFIIIVIFDLLRAAAVAEGWLGMMTKWKPRLTCDRLETDHFHYGLLPARHLLLQVPQGCTLIGIVSEKSSSLMARTCIRFDKNIPSLVTAVRHSFTGSNRRFTR